MTLSQSVRRRVEERAPLVGQVEQILSSEGGLTIRCEVQEAQRLGCALTQIELVAESPTPCDAMELADRAQRICDKVSYLLEPLQPIEVDGLSRTALVRSRTPRKSEGAISYYELLTSCDHHTSLRRYCFDESQRKRRLVEFLLTNDQLELLLEDLMQSAGGRRVH
jgi:hypothetical protein